MPRHRLIAILAGLLAVILAGAVVFKSGVFDAPKPSLVGGPFQLVDQNGKATTEETLKGQWNAVFFGFTYCPDVCPGTLQALAAASDQLGPKAKDLKIVFISVDPARDTPEVLKSFVANFHPRMVGLTGSAAAIDATAKEYAVYYKKGEMSPGGGYMVDHSRVAYLMDPQGKPMALLPQDQSPEAIATEIKRWVK